MGACKRRGRRVVLDTGVKLRHSIDAVDVAGVIAEEDATERREGADQVGLPGDRRLDAVDVRRRRERSASGHAGQMLERGKCTGRLLLRMCMHVDNRVRVNQVTMARNSRS